VTIVIDILFLTFLIFAALLSIYFKNLLNSTIVLGAYSLYVAVLWTTLNAIDVAFTEAAVGAGISTVLFLAVFTKIQPEDRSVIKRNRQILALGTLFFVGYLLILGITDMPKFGDPNWVTNTYLIPDYIERTMHETGAVNIVTAILGSYRGFDTNGETAVIFIAGICTYLILNRGEN
jgi:multicomponent Na+:H+ antiporter subunit B